MPFWNYNKLTAIGILGLLFIFLIWVFITNIKNLITPEPSSVPIIPQPAVQTESQASNTAEPAVSKELLKIQILNGTGEVGLAAKLKDQLTSLGYQNFELGNSKEPQKIDTEVRVKEKLPQEIKTEIVKSLEETFESVAITFQPVDTGYDFVIVTGKLK